MKTPRFRLTIGRMMLGTALLAVALGWGISRPYPAGCDVLGSTQLVLWSDGTMTADDAPNMMQIRGTSWFRAVDFPDGRPRYDLTLR